MTDGYVTGIFDNDPKGLTGIGTIFYVDVTLDNTTVRHTWGLIDQIASKVNPEDWLVEVKQRMSNAARAKQESEETG